VRSKLWVVVAAVVMGACGGSSSTSSGSSGSSGGSFGGPGGSATVRGTLLGKTFTPVDAASYVDHALVSVVFYDAPGVCGDLVANAIKPNSSALTFSIPDATVGMTYRGPSVQFAEFDATCNSPAGESGSGTVTITAAGATSVSGNFSFMLNSDSVTGSFIAPTCAGAPGTGAQICR
jgi:hypothetical protein